MSFLTFTGKYVVSLVQVIFESEKVVFLLMYFQKFWIAASRPWSQEGERARRRGRAPCREGLRVREAPGAPGLCFPWSRALTPRMRLECNPEIAVGPGEEY